MTIIFVGLGSNIDPQQNLRAAAAMLREHFGEVRFSRVYRTAPQGYEDQPPFLNAVARLETEEEPEGVAAVLQEIEAKLEKTVPFRFGPRTIDLDLLLYGDSILPKRNAWPANQKPKTKNYQLILPHPRMHERRFVLEPLCELLDPEGRHPMLGQTWGRFLILTNNQRVACTDLLL